jgi:hypothetical protein
MSMRHDIPGETKRVLGLPQDTELKYRNVWKVDKIELGHEFKQQMASVLIDDGKFTPKNYFGAGLKCNQCHDKAGVPAGYAEGAIIGGDTVLSWRPNTESTVTGGLIGTNPVLDHRWPLESRRP